MAEAPQGSEVEVEIRLRNGDPIKARAHGGQADVAGIHRTLQESEFVQVGDDTIVRSADVQSIQVREQGSGLMDSIRSRVSGGNGDGAEREDGHTTDHGSSRRGMTELGRDGAEIETKPFFLTSEFLLAFAAWVALLLTTLASDSVDAWMFSVLTIAIATGYML